MDNILKEIASLGLIRSLPDQAVQNLKPGRLRGRCEQLMKEVDMLLAFYPQVSDQEREQIGRLYDDLLTRSGWGGKGKHTATVISFLLETAEEMMPPPMQRPTAELLQVVHGETGETPQKVFIWAKYAQLSRIISLLNDMFDYFERADNVPAPCIWGGRVTAEKWKEIRQAA